jgi:hypothetical protein
VLIISKTEYITCCLSLIYSTSSIFLQFILYKSLHAPTLKILLHFNFSSFFLSVALQSLKDLGRLTYRRFLELFRHTVGLLGRVISPSQGLYLYRTTQHRKPRTNIHALSGIRTHDPRNQPVKTHASDRTATVTGQLLLPVLKILNVVIVNVTSELLLI